MTTRQCSSCAALIREADAAIGVIGRLKTEAKARDVEIERLKAELAARPTPTPTPAPGLDLDAVERAERAMTAGPWRHGSVERHHVFCSEGDRSLLCPEAGRVLLRMNEHFPHDSDAAGIVALRNAAPALIAEVRALRAEVVRITAAGDIEAKSWEAMSAEIARLTAELAAARAEVNCGQDGPCVKAPGCARHWQERNRELADELAAARAVPADVEALVKDAVDGALEAGRCSALGHAYLLTKDPAVTVPRLMTAIARAISDATAARGTVGGLLAAGEERESRAWSEKGKAPPGSCPFCASRISMVQRDGYFIARCSHRGCGAVGPRMRSVSRAADLFCQPPRREAQGMSCGPIVASPPRPRCSCTHEAGDSRCNVHPTCSECGASTTRPVDGCEACRGPLPKGG